MVVHDFVCLKCDSVLRNMPYPGDREHQGCGGDLEILWVTSIRRPAVLPLADSTAVYYSPKEKQYQYPGRNDTPVPDRLRKRGYEKVWLRSDSDVGRFEKDNHVVNERRHWDSNGRGGM